MKLGEKIRSLRKEKGWSQVELGEKLGLPGQHISRYETGKIRPRPSILETIAKTFGIPVDALEELSSGPQEIDRQVMTIGEKIRELRRKRNWSQAELGERLGIAAQNVCRYEKDLVTPRTGTLAQFAEVLEVPVEVFTQRSSASGGHLGIEDTELLEYFRLVITLEPEDQEALKRIMKAMINNKRAQSVLAS